MKILFFIVPTLAFLAFSMFIYYAFTSEGRSRLKMRRSHRLDLKDVVDGQIVKIVGSLRSVDGEFLTAPISGQSCVFWQVIVKERGGSDINDWKKRLEINGHPETLTLDDGTGQALIDLEDFRTVMVNEEMHDLDFKKGENADKRAYLEERGLKVEQFGFIGTFRAHEVVLGDGAIVAAMGKCHRKEQGSSTILSISSEEGSPLLLTNDARLQK